MSKGKRLKSKLLRGNNQPPISKGLEEIKKLIELGAEHHRAGRLLEAEACYQKVLQVQPDNSVALNLWGVVASDRGQYEIATQRIKRAIEINPNYGGAYNNLGLALHRQGKLEGALTYYRKAVELNPKCVYSHNNLGNVLQELGQWEEAVAYYQKAIAIEPNYAQTHFNLGNTFWRQKKLDDAIRYYQKAIELDPNYGEAHYNLGVALQDAERLEEAFKAYQKAIQVNPNHSEAHNNLGNIFKEEGKLELAYTYHQKATEINPQNADAQWNLSLLLLLKGNFSQGWQKYEWRWATRQFNNYQPQTPMWDGSASEGKSIVLWNEQGLGDAIQFIRYAKKLKELGLKVVISAHHPLVSLFKQCLQEEIEVLENTSCNIYSYDYQSSIMSLPGIFYTNLDNIPDPIPYIFAPQPLPPTCILPRTDNYRLGIVWAAGKYKPTMYQQKSCPIELFMGLLELGNVNLYSLQVGEDAGEIEPWLSNRGVHNLSSLLKDFSCTAAVIEQLDLVLTVDTAVAHLAGAMGKPVWVLLPLLPDWRWLLERSDSPWYPTMRLFRQRGLGDWRSVFEQVRKRLQAVMAGQSPIFPLDNQVNKTEIKDSPTSEQIKQQLDLGIKYQQEGRASEAEACYRQVLQWQTDNPIALNLWGVIAAEQEEYEIARERIARAIELNPNYYGAHNNLGNVLKGQEKFEEAIKCYQRAIELAPNFPDAHHNLGNALKEQEKLEEAIESYQRAIELNPNYAEAYNSLGNVLKEQEKIEEAIECYYKAIELNPNYGYAYYNLGIEFHQQGNLEDAIEYYQRAIELNPNHASAHFNLSLLLLLKGNFRQGWEEYKWRMGIKKVKNANPKTPIWDGSSLEGKSIVLWNDQGLGDAIQFIRYETKLREMGARVVVSVRTPLVSLFENCLAEKFEILDEKDCNIYNYDHHCLLMSLPGILQTDSSNLPCSIPYIFAPNPLPADCILPPSNSLRIGVVWASGRYQSEIEMYRAKSCPVELFIGLLELGNIAFYSLQVGEDAGEIEPWLKDGRVHNLSPILKDFAHTAAVVEQLDLVITVDTAVAHLAGAMGKPVWVLLPFMPDWRWLLEREDSPWYPTIRLFRQGSKGDWQGVFEQVRKGLQAVMAGQSPIFPVGVVQGATEAVDDQTYFNLGMTYCQEGQLVKAEESFRRAISLNPNNLQASNNLAVVLWQRGLFGEAEEVLNQTLRIDPNYGDAHRNLGILLKKTGRLTEAQQHYQEAIRLNRYDTNAYYNLARLFEERGLLSQTGEVLFRLGIALYEQDLLAEAEDVFRKSIALKGKSSDGYYNLGITLKDLGKLTEAIEAYQQAIALKPDYSEAYNNIGNVLLELGKLEEAEENCRKALTIRPDNVNAYVNLGNILRAKGVLTHHQPLSRQAEQAYRHAITINPSQASTHVTLALFLLLQGNFEEGWEEYEWRLQSDEVTLPPSPCPQWHGEDLGQKTLLLMTEQGMGDAIHFVRYLPILQNRGIKLKLLCDHSLVSLFQESFPIEIIPKDEEKELPAHDVHLPLMSLPRLLATNLENIPLPIPYLKVSKQPAVILEGNHFKVGIVWGTSITNKELYKRKTCPANLFLQLLSIPQLALYSLQVGKDAEAIRSHIDNQQLFDLSGKLQDFADTATVIEQLDLVITVDTAVAHLAGAMGKPVWTLLPFVPDWRWLLDRQDSPWYPTMRLFRQPKLGDWEGVFEQVKEKLKLVVAGESAIFPLKTTNVEKIISVPKSEKKTIRIEFSRSSGKCPLGIGWPMSVSTGWGNYGLNLVLQLKQINDFAPILLADSNLSDNFNPLHRELLKPLFLERQKWQPIIQQNQDKEINLGIPVLHGLGNGFHGGLNNIKGDRNIGVIFFENTRLPPDALERAKKYDLIIAGSTWNAEVLQSYGLKNVRTVFQGIDPTKFHPAPKSNLLKNRFVIFSGGKLEYRKGQDIAIAAFKIFAPHHPDALLLTSWHNFWPQYMQGIDYKGYVQGQPQLDQNKSLQIKSWLLANGIPEDSCLDVGLIPNHLVGQIVREADVAVFTNRGEGGTNLVAMECLACGIPSILSANTGHLDLIREEHCYSLSHQSQVQPTQLFPSVDGWGESDVDEVVEALERVYNNREEAKQKGVAAAIFMQDWTWEKQIRRFCDVLINAGIVY